MNTPGESPMNGLQSPSQSAVPPTLVSPVSLPTSMADGTTAMPPRGVS